MAASVWKKTQWLAALIAGTATIALPVAASAQDGGQGRGEHRGGWNGGARPDGQGRSEGRGGWNGGGRSEGRGWDRDGDRRWDRDGDRDRRWDSRPSWSSRPSGGWNRDWRNDRRYSWRDWRSNHREVYRLGRYSPPYRSHVYSRIGIGFMLQSGFFGASYWINDPWAYRLPPAYGPYRWVRYYDDAMLVDTYSGEVVDVIYDFFW